MEISSQPLTLRNLLDVFKRHRVGMLVIFLLCLIGGAVAYYLTPEVYRSKTAILVDAPSQNLNDPVSQVTLPNQATDIVTQSAILQSSRILFETYRTAGVLIPEGVTPEVLDRLLPRVTVEPVPGTSIIDISVDTRDPQVGFKVAQIIPDVYLGYQRSSRQAEVDKALEFLTQRLKDQTDALAKDEKALEDFKARRTLLPMDNEGQTRGMLLSDAKVQLVNTKAGVAAAKQRLDNYLKELASIPASRRIASKQANMVMLEEQRGQIAQLIAKREELLQVYMSDRDEVKQIDAQLAVARKRLEEIPKQADTTTDTRPQTFFSLEQSIATSRAELKAAQAQEAEIQAWFSSVEGELRAYNLLQGRQNELTRQVEESKTSLDSITKAYEELRLRRNSAKEPVAVLMQATVPSKIQPMANRPIGIAMLVGLFLAVAFALLKDSLDDKIASTNEVEQMTLLPMLGEAKVLPRRYPRAKADRLRAALVESYRLLRFNTRFVAGDEGVRSILVTSNRSEDLSNEVAFNLAAASASPECRVILIDANLRSPSIHKRIDRLREIPGLSDVVLGKATLEECYQQSALPDLKILTSGSPVDDPVDLFSSPNMRNLLAKLGEACDLLILDGPPAVGFADVPALSSLVETVVYVARPGITRRSELRRGLELIRQAGGRVLGLASIGMAKG